MSNPICQFYFLRNQFLLNLYINSSTAFIKKLCVLKIKNEPDFVIACSLTCLVLPTPAGCLSAIVNIFGKPLTFLLRGVEINIKRRNPAVEQQPMKKKVWSALIFVWTRFGPVGDLNSARLMVLLSFGFLFFGHSILFIVSKPLVLPSYGLLR